MATFMEAMQAARAGRLVKIKDLKDWNYWDNILQCLCDVATQDVIYIDDQILDSEYEIGPMTTKEKEYTFLEAVEMMKQGKVMKSAESLHTFRSSYDRMKADSDRWLWFSEIEGKWIEVK